MFLQYYVTESATGNRVNIEIDAATQADLDIVFSPMSDETMSWLDELFSTCKRFHVDYLHASEKDKFFVEAVALHEYQLKKAHEQGLKRADVPPFLGLKRTERSNEMPA